jgi:general secretion pathway protein E
MGTIVENLDGSAAEEDDVEHLRDLASEAPVIRLVNLILQRAVEQRASDVHIEPFENRLKVRYRIDGVLHEVEAPPSSSTAAVISRVKIMARLNIAERRLPQDGRIQLRVQGKELDLRVSTVPTSFGESVVMRILDRESVVFDFASLGFTDSFQQRFVDVLEKPHGILLVTGPTGSGKTTTLYGSLLKLNDSSRNIMTVEDPIEYYLDGVGQTQVNTRVDMTFARGLRAILRQDPDVVMVGEIRDLETAEIAVQASLTGHLVLSTLHTNSAAGAVARLRDMGVEPFLLASSLIGVFAQRLVRVLDPATREAYVATPAELAAFGQPAGSTATLYRPRSDLAGNRQAGYRGRTGIYELISVDDTLRRLVHEGASEAELERHARTRSPAMLEDGWRKCLAGITSSEEVLRVTREE